MNQQGCLLRPLSALEMILKDYTGSLSKLTTKSYQILLGNRGGLARAKVDWEKDLDEPISLGMEADEFDRQETFHECDNKRK